jgi:hypothetical protein
MQSKPVDAGNPIVLRQRSEPLTNGRYSTVRNTARSKSQPTCANLRPLRSSPRSRSRPQPLEHQRRPDASTGHLRCTVVHERAQHHGLWIATAVPITHWPAARRPARAWRSLAGASGRPYAGSWQSANKARPAVALHSSSCAPANSGITRAYQHAAARRSAKHDLLNASEGASASPSDMEPDRL